MPPSSSSSFSSSPSSFFSWGLDDWFPRKTDHFQDQTLNLAACRQDSAETEEMLRKVAFVMGMENGRLFRTIAKVMENGDLSKKRNSWGLES